jgi:hypothetical protein
MGNEERRRDYRFAVTLEGTFARGRAPIRVANVGYRGMLIATNAPVVVGQLAQIVVTVPSVGSVVLHGVPVRLGGDCDLEGDEARGGAAARASDGRLSARGEILLGVKLIGAEPRWETYVRGLHVPPLRKIALVAASAREAP